MFVDCGIGSDQNASGPCTGTYGGAQEASKAGGHVFDGVHHTPVMLAIIAAGALLAGLLFARWASRKVGGFFSDGDAQFSDDATRDRFGGPTAEWRFEEEEGAPADAPRLERGA